jgi:hypothetical protein
MEGLALQNATLQVTGANRTCAVCGTAIGSEAKDVPGLGQLDGDCAKKYGAFETFLQHHKLESYLEERTTDAYNDGKSWLVPRWLLDMEFKARTIGFTFVKKFATKREPYQISYRLEHRHTMQARLEFINAYEKWQTKNQMEAVA